MHLESGALCEQALAVADQRFDRLHDEVDGGKRRAVGRFGAGLIARAEGIVGADGVVDEVGGEDQAGAAEAEIVGEFEAAAAVEDA